MKFTKNMPIMTKQQEQLFCQKTKKTTGKYFWAALLFVLLFQIYNIAFALYYTDFRLDTESSRIYMVLYVSMIFVCLLFSAIGLIFKLTGKKADAFLVLYAAFGCALLLWSICITLYDQRLSTNMSIYLTTAIYIAGLIYMSPKLSIPVFVFSEIFFLVGLRWIDINNIRDTYGSCVNSAGFTIIALFISLYRWSTLRRDFMNHMEIEEKNRMITEQSEKLSYMANHDPLTGLWNRNYLNQWLEDFFSSGNSEEMAVFVADIDYFKQYNDTFGHIAGDECLKKVALTLQAAGGTVFRFGGEEFLFLHQNKPESLADKLAVHLCRQVEELQIESARSGKALTISIGYAAGSMRSDLEFRDLLHKADTALYQAKASGRNRAVKYGAEKDSI